VLTKGLLGVFEKMLR